jgi:hypothetical protein
VCAGTTCAKQIGETIDKIIYNRTIEKEIFLKITIQTRF